MTTFDEILARARQISGMTDAEFDYSLSLDPDDRGFSALGAIRTAAHQLANAGLPEVDLVAATEDLRQRDANYLALLDSVRPELDEMIRAAKAKKYTGWSVRSGPIRYATESEAIARTDQWRDIDPESICIDGCSSLDCRRCSPETAGQQ